MDRSMIEILGGVKLYVTLMICLAILTVELPIVSGFPCSSSHRSDGCHASCCGGRAGLLLGLANEQIGKNVNTLWLFNIAMENDPFIDDDLLKVILSHGYVK